MTWTIDTPPAGSWTANPLATRLVRVTEAGDRRIIEDATAIRVLETSFIRTWSGSNATDTVWTPG